MFKSCFSKRMRIRAMKFFDEVVAMIATMQASLRWFVFKTVYCVALLFPDSDGDESGLAMQFFTLEL